LTFEVLTSSLLHVLLEYVLVS